MCKYLKISRSLIYYNSKENVIDSELEDKVIKIFKASRNNYGTRKIRKELLKLKHKVSRRRIGKIMKKYKLVSQYTVKQFIIHKTKCNEEAIANEVNRDFNRATIQDVIVSDLTQSRIWGFVTDYFVSIHSTR